MAETVCKGQRFDPGAAIHIFKADLADILAKAGTPYTATNFSQVCREVNGASADFRTNFGNGHRELSIKIPHQALNEDQLKTIDGCEYILSPKILKLV